MRRVQVYLSMQSFGRLQARAARQSATASALARQAVMAWLNADSLVLPRAPICTDLPSAMAKSRQVGVRVPGAVYSRLVMVSADYAQTPAGWAAALLAHVLLGRPIMRRDEVAAVEAASRQLWSIGVLLNQIARGINVDLKSPASANTSQVTPQLMHECLATIRSTTERVHDLIESNSQAYRQALCHTQSDITNG